MSSVKATPEPDAFLRELEELLDALAQWQLDVSSESGSEDPDEFPEFNQQSYIRATAFAALLMLTYGVFLVVRHVSLLSYFFLAISLAVSGGAMSVYLLDGIGFFSRRFWRAWRSLISGSAKCHYPVAWLRDRLLRHAAARPILENYRLEILQCAVERIRQQDSDLRDRLGFLVGTPTVWFIFGVAASLAGMWRIAHNYGLGTPAMLVAAMAFGVYLLLLRMRFRMFALSDCQSFLSLEIARRLADHPMIISPRRKHGNAASITA